MTEVTHTSCVSPKTITNVKQIGQGFHNDSTPPSFQTGWNNKIYFYITTSRQFCSRASHHISFSRNINPHYYHKWPSMIRAFPLLSKWWRESRHCSPSQSVRPSDPEYIPLRHGYAYPDYSTWDRCFYLAMYNLYTIIICVCIKLILSVCAFVRVWMCVREGIFNHLFYFLICQEGAC